MDKILFLVRMVFRVKKYATIEISANRNNVDGVICWRKSSEW